MLVASTLIPKMERMVGDHKAHLETGVQAVMGKHLVVHQEELNRNVTNLHKVSVCMETNVSFHIVPHLRLPLPLNGLVVPVGRLTVLHQIRIFRRGGPKP